MFRKFLSLLCLSILFLATGCEDREFEIESLSIKITEDLSGFVKLMVLPPAKDYTEDYYDGLNETGKTCGLTWEKTKAENNKNGLLYTKEFETVTDLNKSINCISFKEMTFKVNTSESFLSKNYEISILIPDLKKLRQQLKENKKHLDKISEIQAKLPSEITSVEDYISTIKVFYEITGQKKYSPEESENARESVTAAYQKDKQKFIDEGNAFLEYVESYPKQIESDIAEQEEKLTKKTFQSYPIRKVRIFLPGQIKPYYKSPNEIAINEEKNIGTVDWSIEYLKEQQEDSAYWDFQGEMILKAKSKIPKIDSKYIITTGIATVGLIFGTGLVQYLKRQSS